MDHGEISINNKKLNTVASQWHKHVAYMPQQSFLIDDTVLRNIALGEMDEDIDDIKVKDVIRKASLQGFIESLPEGVDTILGEQGIKISGGQRQRIELARALYCNRGVLVMDESTSSLDHGTEKEIISEIKKLRGKKTMIVVAHRFSTVEHCDRIFRLENGKLIHSNKLS